MIFALLPANYGRLLFWAEENRNIIVARVGWGELGNDLLQRSASKLKCNRGGEGGLESP